MKKSKRALRELTYYLTPRYLLGIALIFLAFLSAYAITRASDRTITVWSATANLPIGSSITASDLAPIQVRLLGNAANYIKANQDIVGTVVISPISSDDLIPVSSISEEFDPYIARVPITLAREATPAGLTRGSLVDIYAIPITNQYGDESGMIRKPRLILPNISIDGIDGTNRDLGGSTVVTVLVSTAQVADLIAAMPGNSFLFVRRILG